MKKGFVVFDSSAKEFVLGVFGKTVDKDGFIIDKNTKEKELSPSLEPLTMNDFAGICKGSLLFVKNDLPSLVDLSDRLTDNV